jgi:hypothetical protein
MPPYRVWGNGGGRKVVLFTPSKYGGSRGRAPLILKLGTGWRLATSSTPRTLSNSEEQQFPMNMKMTGPQNGSGLDGVCHHVIL